MRRLLAGVVLGWFFPTAVGACIVHPPMNIMRADELYAQVSGIFFGTALDRTSLTSSKIAVRETLKGRPVHHVDAVFSFALCGWEPPPVGADVLVIEYGAGGESTTFGYAFNTKSVYADQLRAVAQSNSTVERDARKERRRSSP